MGEAKKQEALVTATLWDEIVRQARVDPYLYRLVTVVELGKDREEGLMELVIALAGERARLVKDYQTHMERCVMPPMKI